MMNTLLDKTFKAAKQSALQIYDDDLTQIKSMISSDEDDEQSEDQGEEQHHEKEDQQQGVVFERSSGTDTKAKDSNGKESDKLQALRDYAAQQSEDMDSWDSPKDATPAAEKVNERSKKESSSQIYSRKDIRKESKANGSEEPKESVDGENKELSDQPAESVSSVTPPPEQTEEDGEFEKRLDRLESLMHLSFMADDLNYSSHPAYHKLLHKGVSKKLVTQWFEDICQQGINPDKQQELVNTKLQQVIEELLAASKAERVGDILIFAGRSGSGKTTSVMRLCEHATFGAEKSVAIASIIPETMDQPYYSILESYCADKEISYYKITDPEQLEDHIEEWKTFDNIFIDTPSMEREDAEVAENISVLKAKLEDQFSIETHFLVNTAISGSALNDPLASLIDADHLLLTHLDKSMKWGQAVQLMSQTDYRLRFISGGEAIPKSLLPFHPKRFVEKLLR